MPGLKISQFTKEHDPAVAIAAASAASSTPLGGDLSGTPGAAVVEKIAGISITGAPSGAGDEIIATSTTAAHWATPPASLSNPMTALDDLIVGGTVTGGVAAPARLGKGSDGQVLTVDPVTHHLLWATPAGGSLEVKEADGSPDVTGVTKIVLPNGSLTDNTGGQVTIAFPGGGGVTVQDEGTPLATTADTLNFAGAGVTATGSGTTKTITIPGGGGSVTVEDLQSHSVSGVDTLVFPKGWVIDETGGVVNVYPSIPTSADRAALGTYGDECDTLTPDAAWVLRNIASVTGDGDAYSLYLDASGDAFTRPITDPAANFEIIAHVVGLSGGGGMCGICCLDGAGTGRGFSPYNDGNAYQWAITTYAYSGTGPSPAGWNSGYMADHWQHLRRVGTAWSARFSADGNIWSSWSSTATDGRTITQIGFVRAFATGGPYTVKFTRFVYGTPSITLP